jgi:protein-S-isoprenylcysteine O-methyltransferase Ste14
MLLFAKNFLFTVFGPGTVAVFVPYRIAARAHPGWGFERSRLLCFLLGAGIYFWCLWDFAISGRGTPAPIDPPKHLVVRGLYRYVRNPMYLGVWLVVAAWAVFTGSGRVVQYGLGVAVVAHLFVVLVEEPLLRHRFGTSYEAYCRAVSRWLPGTAYRPAL